MSLTHCWTALDGDLQLSGSVKLWTSLNFKGTTVMLKVAAAEVGDRTKETKPAP